MEFLVAEYFNADLADLDGRACNEAILADIVMVRLEDMTDHFLSHHLPWW